jgi:histidine ammonia-lyase
VLAIEFYTAAQAMEFRRPLRTSDTLETMLSHYRKVVPAVEKDRIMGGDMEATVGFLKKG